jgi:uncharacterized protein with PIN domain
MKLLILLSSCVVFWLLGFGMGTFYAEKRFKKSLDTLSTQVDELTEQTIREISDVIKEIEADGCNGCHEDRELPKIQNKKVQSIPRKVEQETMRIHVCESCNTEEEEGEGPG